MDFGAEACEHPVIALPGERRVGAAAGIGHRASDDDPAGAIVECAAGMTLQFVKKRLAERFEAQALLEDRRTIEAAAGGDRLERLDETAVLRPGQIFGDRPWPGFDRDTGSGCIVLPKAQCRPENLRHRRRRRECQQPCIRAGCRCGHDGVGRAEIEPDGLARGSCLHEGPDAPVGRERVYAGELVWLASRAAGIADIDDPQPRPFCLHGLGERQRTRSTAATRGSVGCRKMLAGRPP